MSKRGASVHRRAEASGAPRSPRKQSQDNLKTWKRSGAANLRSCGDRKRFGARATRGLATGAARHARAAARRRASVRCSRRREGRPHERPQRPAPGRAQSRSHASKAPQGCIESAPVDTDFSLWEFFLSSCPNAQDGISVSQDVDSSAIGFACQRASE